MGLTSATVVRNWANEDLDISRNTELTRCVVVVDQLLPELCQRQIEQASFTKNFNGYYDAKGPSRQIIELPAGHRPVAHSGGDVVTVSENGTALTVGTGYDTDLQVVLLDANEDKQCRLVRQNSPWSPGLQNIEVTYKAGWTSGAMPTYVVQLANELSWMIFIQPEILNKLSRSKGSTATFDKHLSPIGKMALRKLMVRGG